MSTGNYSIHRFQLSMFVEEAEDHPEEQPTNLNDVSFEPYIYRNEINQNLSNTPTQNNDQIRFEIVSSPSTHYNPFSSEIKLQRLINQFQTKILHDYPSIPCAYCSILMMKDSTKWLPYDEEERYTLTLAFSDIPVYIRENNRRVIQVAVCNGCKNSKTRRYPPILTEIPLEITNVPMVHRRYLSPVYMGCSLGRTAGTNPYTNYRHLKGSIGISHNYRTLMLYSGSTGAYLNSNEPPTWFHESLTPASEWLKQNNNIIRKYASDINITRPSPESTIPIPLPLARQSIDSSVNPYRSSLPNETPRPPDLVVPNDSFPREIHNEDAHHSRLIAGSTWNDSVVKLPILFKNPDLEALMFPDLFPKGRGHYEDIKQLLSLQSSIESYGKYIKLRMLCPDPRFRLHWYWPHWSYLNLEKKKLPKSTSSSLY